MASSNEEVGDLEEEDFFRQRKEITRGKGLWGGEEGAPFKYRYSEKASVPPGQPEGNDGRRKQVFRRTSVERNQCILPPKQKDSRTLSTPGERVVGTSFESWGDPSYLWDVLLLVCESSLQRRGVGYRM